MLANILRIVLPSIIGGIVARGEKIAAWTLVFAVLAAAGAWFVVPEFRRWTGLEKPQQIEAKPQPTQQPLTPTLADSPQKQPNSTSDELPGTWADQVRSEFYRFYSDGRVDFRFHRFDEPSVLSPNMTWYRVGQTIYLKSTLPVNESCKGTLSGNVIRGTCDTSAGRLGWVLHQLENQPPPQKTKNQISRKPEPTSGIWLDNNLRANGKPVFIELLSGGKVRQRFGLDGYPLPSQDTWYRLGETVRLTEFVSTGTLECEGKPQGETIEGTCKSGATGQPGPWKLERVKK